MKSSYFAGLVLAGTLLVVAQAHGQATNNVVETVQQSITAQARSWETVLMQHATSLFWILAVIEVGIAAVWLAIQGSTLESFFSELVRRIMFIGFFLFVMTNGPDLAKAIVSSLFQIGSGSGDVSPAAVFDAGIDVANRMTQQLAWWNPGDFGKNVIVGVCALSVIAAFGLVAAILLAVILEMYVGLLAGMILLGFGGSSYTKDFAIKYLVYAFSVGMKIMVLVMVAAIGARTLIDVSAAPDIDQSFIGPASIAGLAIVIAYVSMLLPPVISGVIQGVSVTSGMEAARPTMNGYQFGAGVAAMGATAIGAGGRAAAGAFEKGGFSGAAAAATAATASTAVRGIAATASAIKDQAIGGPGSFGTTTMGLANAKLAASDARAAKPSPSGQKPGKP